MFCNAQFTTYYTNDIAKAVFYVGNMQPQEIRNFNKWSYQDWGEGLCLLHVNADRAHANLMNAPATIISFVFWGGVTSSDNLPNYIGAQNMSIQLINTTPKTIKTITFKFAFYNQNGTQVFDTKTGNSYCSLTFSNLKGRANSNSHNQTALDLFNCYHLLTLKNATEKTLFYNNNIATCRLEEVLILYNDGTKSSEASFVEQNCTSVIDFLKQSPFVPIFDSYNYSKIRGHSFMNESYKVDAVDEDKGTNDITKDVVKVEQIVVPEVKPKEEKKEPKPRENEIYKSAAHMPSFPGGDAALMSFINKNINYPQVAIDNGIQGKVIVQFVVEKNGDIGEVKVARGVDKNLDREAIRVCKMLPSFYPGRNALGDPVRVWYTLPVTFKLTPIYDMNYLINEWEEIYKQYYNLLSKK